MEPPCLPIHFTGALSKPIVKFPKTHPATSIFVPRPTSRPTRTIRFPCHRTFLVKKKRRSRSLTLRNKRHRPNLPQSEQQTLPSLKTTPPPQQAISAKNDLKEGKSEEGIHFEKSEDQGKHSKTVLLAQNANPSPINRRDSALTPPKPQTRPKLSPELIRGPPMKSSTTAHRIGTVAIECRLHPYGVYLKKCSNQSRNNGINSPPDPYNFCKKPACRVSSPIASLFCPL